MLNRDIAKILLVVAPINVLAAGVDTELSASVSQEYSDNIFKLDTGSPLYSVVENADVITQTGIAVYFSKEVSRQVFLIRANLSQNSYQNNDQLDNQSNFVELDWKWAVGSKVRGDLGYRRAEQLKDFENQIGIEKNAETNDAAYVSAEVGLNQNVAVVLDLEASEVSNELQAKKEFDRSELVRQISLRYSPTQKTNFVIGQVQTLGVPESEIGNSSYEFDQDKLFISVNYNPSPKTRLGLSSGIVKRDIAGQSSVEADDASLEWSWRLTNKSNLNVNLSKRLSSSSSESVAYTESTLADVAYNYQYSSKLGLSASFSKEDRISNLVNFNEDLEEMFDSLAVNASYQAAKYLGLVLRVKSLSRVSSSDISDYDVQTVYLGVNLKL